MGRPPKRPEGNGRAKFLRALRKGPISSYDWPFYFGSANSMKTTVSQLRSAGYIIHDDSKRPCTYSLGAEPQGYCTTCGRDHDG